MGISKPIFQYSKATETYIPGCSQEILSRTQNTSTNGKSYCSKTDQTLYPSETADEVTTTIFIILSQLRIVIFYNSIMSMHR